MACHNFNGFDAHLVTMLEQFPLEAARLMLACILLWSSINCDIYGIFLLLRNNKGILLVHRDFIAEEKERYGSHKQRNVPSLWSERQLLHALLVPHVWQGCRYTQHQAEDICGGTTEEHLEQDRSEIKTCKGLWLWRYWTF